MDFEGMPKTRFQRHYPNILEYSTTPEDKITYSFGDDDTSLDELLSTTATTITKQDKILSLFSAFTNNLFFRYKDSSGSWGLPILDENPGDEFNSSSSKWSLGLFFFQKCQNSLSLLA
jgi:hypothetical protein